MKINIDEYEYFYLTCEGTNEVEVLNWIIDENRFNNPENLYSRDFLRSLRSKKNRECFLDKEVFSLSFNKKVAIIYIHDSSKENWNVSKRHQEFMKIRNVEVINVITHPEIEVLAIINNNSWYSKWNKGTKVKPSVFLKDKVNLNFKQASNFIELFDNNFENFVEACKKYNRTIKSTKALSILDLIKV